MTYQRNNADYRFTPVDGEMVMLHKPSGKLIGMNTVAAAIWMKIKEPTLFPDIVEFLLDNFEVEKKTCEEQTEVLLNRMIKDKMIFLDENGKNE